MRLWMPLSLRHSLHERLAFLTPPHHTHTHTQQTGNNMKRRKTSQESITDFESGSQSRRPFNPIRQSQAASGRASATPPARDDDDTGSCSVHLSFLSISMCFRISVHQRRLASAGAAAAFARCVCLPPSFPPLSSHTCVQLPPSPLPCTDASIRHNPYPSQQAASPSRPPRPPLLPSPARAKVCVKRFGAYICVMQVLRRLYICAAVWAGFLLD